MPSITCEREREKHMRIGEKYLESHVLFLFISAYVILENPTRITYLGDIHPPLY